MHFVDKKTTKAPAKLEQCHKQWCEYLDNLQQNPNTAKIDLGEAWNDKEVVGALATLFQENCGYCGTLTDKTINRTNNEVYIRNIDHFIPKSRPDGDRLRYCWTNLIWSCPACNSGATGKGTYYKPDCMLFNPCNETDTDYLIYNEDTGSYQLKETYRHDLLLKQRLDVTFKSTTIDDFGKRQSRQREVRDLKESLDWLYKFRNLPKKKEQYLQKTIQRIWEENRFILLKKYVVMLFIDTHPQFPYTLIELGFNKPKED